MKSVQQTLNEVNEVNLQIAGGKVDQSSEAFKPRIPRDLARADTYTVVDKRPLRVLSLGE